MVSISAVSTAPKSEAALLGTAYQLPALSFGGGNDNGTSYCATDNVVVGVTFNQNPMVWGYKCAPLNADLTISSISSLRTSFPNYVFCPDGMAAIGVGIINSGAYRLGLQCRTPPGLSDTTVETEFVATAANPVKLNRTTAGLSYAIGPRTCNTGDLLMGFRTWSNLWFDQLYGVCAPFQKFNLSYSVNGGSGSAPATQTQSAPNETLTIASYSGTRSGYTLNGWNSAANGSGTNYQVGDAKSGLTANLPLYAQWDSTITYDSNTATTGTVPNPTTAKSSAAVTTLATNSGTLARTGYTFSGWNTLANGAGNYYAAGLATYASTGSTTLYAQWNSTITYNGNGNTSGSVPAVTTAKGDAANTTLATNSGTLAKTNYVFDGWNTAANGTGTSYAAGATNFPSPGNTTLYAQWKAAITFSGNTNNGGAAPAIVNAITATITLPSNTGSLTKVGYAFAGWNTLANGAGTSYAAGATYTVAGATTLYAEWAPDNSGLTPSFNTNTNDVIGLAISGNVVINTAYTNDANDLVVSQFPDLIQIIASVPLGNVAITTTTGLTLPIGYQAALNSADTEISFIGTAAQVNAALATLKYTAPATTGVSTTISIYAAYAGINGNYRYNPITGSSYSRGSTTLSWVDGYATTTASSNCGIAFNGMCGYLLAPQEVAESTFAASKLGTGLIGVLKSGGLKYVSNAPSGDSLVTVTNWNTGEGSDVGNNYVAINWATGKWGDFLNPILNPLYEYGGKSETPIFAALTRTVQVASLATPGTPALAAASDTGSSATDKTTNDNTPDVIIAGITVGATITLTATKTGGGTVTCTFVATSTTQTCTFPTLSDGTWSIAATQTIGGATSAAGTALGSVVIDTVGPTVAISATVGAGTNVPSGSNDVIARNTAISTYTIKATFSESVTGLLLTEILKDAESSAWTYTSVLSGSGASYTFTATNSGILVNTPGVLKLRIDSGVAVDAAGNSNSATSSDYVINSVAKVDFWDCGPTGQYCTGGTGPTSVTQTSTGSSVALPGPNTLYKTGFSFIGWGETQTAVTILTGTYTPSTRIILFPQFRLQVKYFCKPCDFGNCTCNSIRVRSSPLTGTVATNSGALARTNFAFRRMEHQSRRNWNTL